MTSPLTGTNDGQDAIAVAGTATGNGSIGVRGDGAMVGVWGTSRTGEGVHAHTESAGVAAMAAFNVNPQGTGAAVFAEKRGDVGHAGFFVGNVHVTRNLFVEGDITLPTADFAEDFYVAEPDGAEPGTVMVLDEGQAVRPSDTPYDKRVAGVVSGAGSFRPAIVLDKRPEGADRRPIALLGKVYCKVDADYAPIEVGDLLTTSATVGHAMKAVNPLDAFGAVIGKALAPLDGGRSLIPIFITLQ